MKRAITLFQLIILIFFGNSLAQTRHLKFDRITGTKEVSLGTINAITQDKFGFIWFSDETNHCITRYDGNSMKQYRHDHADSTSIGSNYIECLANDSTGAIWIGHTEGVDRFDPQTEIFTHYRHDPNNPESLSSGGVNVIIIDHLGKVWVGTNGGLDLLNQTTGKFTHYRHKEGDTTSLSFNIVRSIYEDRAGTIWVGTGFTSIKEGGLNRLDRNTGTFTQYLHDPENPHSLMDNPVRSIFEDSKGNFWIGTRGGVHTMDRKSGLFTRHEYDTTHPEKLSSPPNKTGGFELVTFIKEDTQHNIWIGSVDNGFNRYDPLTNKVKHFGNNTDDFGTLIENSSWCIFVARDGLIWLSTQPGLYRIDPNYTKIPHTSSHLDGFFQESPSISWTGTLNGLVKEDLRKRTSIKFVHDEKNSNSISSDLISAFLKDRQGSIWIGTSAVLNEFDTATGFFKHYLFDSDDSVAMSLITAIYEDPQSNLWIGTASGSLRKLDRKTGRFTNLRIDLSSPHAVQEFLFTIEEYDSASFLVVFQNAVNKVNWKEGSVTPYLKGYQVNKLYRDGHGTLWIGTDQGLYKQSPGSDKLTNVLNEAAYSIIGDSDHNLWVSSSAGFFKISIEPERIIQFSKENQETNPFRFNTGRAYQKQDGQILLGEPWGYYAFYPDKLEHRSDTSGVYITELWLNGKPAKPASGESLPKSLFDLRSIELDYDQNVFSFDITEVDFHNSVNEVIYYKLEKYDDAWRETYPGDKVNYFKVPPGEYSFKIKAIHGASGIISERNIAISIAPPWWQTWWAYALYGLTGIGLLVLGRNEVVRRERARSARRIEHMELEKIKEVDQVKSAFFTNISHEFRTPLTIINGQVSAVMEVSKSPETKDRLKQVMKNSNLLLKLVNQLLDLAKLESGDLAINKVDCRLNSFLNVTVSAFSSLALQRNIKLNLSHPKKAWVVLLDEQKLETILNNLISNAIKFTSSGGTITVSAMLEADAVSFPTDSTLILHVQDTGIGIAKEQQSKVFDRFYQVNDSHTEIGTGIGLALVKQLAGLMGGSVSVESEVNLGTTFTVALPIRVQAISETQGEIINAATDINNYEDGVGAIEEEMDNRDKPKLLIVEDNIDLVKFIMDTLGTDYVFLKAGNGKRGLEIAIEETPDLIVSDLMMPEMDGFAMLEKLKADFRTSHIPVILLTAKATIESKLTGLHIGADDYLTKPFERRVLTIKVKNVITTRVKMRDKIRMEILKESPRIEAVSADERFIVKLRDKIIERMTDKQLSVESLAHDLGMSRAQFYRKVTALTGMSVNDLIRSFRLEKAAQLLVQGWDSVAQIAYEVGFSNPSYFSKCFKDHFGVLPSEYQSKA
jgi:signal transduction histidine kinase/ligand-binding sensor domain-containing protein/DNA-binding response OmpR family regulator